MKAIIINRYGTAQELTLAEQSMPIVAPDQVLVRVKAFGINPLDWMIRRGLLEQFTGNQFPKILGGDFAGVIESVGPAVINWKPGQAVFGMVHTFFGQSGSYAEYVSVSPQQLAAKPSTVSFLEAATIPLSGLTALQGLRQCVQPGQRVLVHGASGGVGLFAVQIARLLGGEVTAVCGPDDQEWVSELGATTVLSYLDADWPESAGYFDTIFDVVGKFSFEQARPLLQSGGTFLTTQATPANFALVGEAASAYKYSPTGLSKVS